MKSALVRAAVAAICALGGLSAGCASAPKPIVISRGVERCPDSAAGALLDVDALECWFPATHAQWRTLSHESHYDVLVVTVEVFDLRDAGEIASRFVANQRDAFSEIMIYAHPPASSGTTRIRRVRWARGQGSETFDFDAPPVAR